MDGLKLRGRRWNGSAGVLTRSLMDGVKLRGRRWVVMVLVACAAAGASVTMAPKLYAASSDEEKIINPRFEGYGEKPVNPGEASPALTYILLLVLTGLGVAVMCVNPKRTHLD